MSLQIYIILIFFDFSIFFTFHIISQYFHTTLCTYLHSSVRMIRYPEHIVASWMFQATLLQWSLMVGHSNRWLFLEWMSTCVHSLHSGGVRIAYCGIFLLPWWYLELGGMLKVPLLDCPGSCGTISDGCWVFYFEVSPSWGLSQWLWPMIVVLSFCEGCFSQILGLFSTFFKIWDLRL